MEKFIYNLVKKNVALKNFLRKIYQGFFLIIPPKKVETTFEINSVEGYFFGFHDKSPWNFENNKILAQKYPKNLKGLPSTNDVLEIGYFENDDLSNFKSLEKTCSWNWQQASMLQWVGKKDLILFNFWDKDSNKAKIIDTTGKTIKILPEAIGSTSHDGKYAVAYDFERLNIGMFGYGYANSSKEVLKKDKNIPESLGFSIYTIDKNEKIAFKSVFEINELLGDRKFKNAYVFVSHFIFSDDNSRVLFLLREYTKGKRLLSRLITCDINGENMYLLPTGDMVSHLSWIKSDKILAYCTDKNNEEGYYVFNDLSQDYKRIAKDDYSYDGHPQFYPQHKTFVTDSYPNRRRQQELSIYDMALEKKTLIAKFFSPTNFIEEFRSDLHPRWDRKGEKICVDTPYTGKRGLAILSIK